MDAMTIALIVLVAAAVWAVVELALTLRRTRRSVADLTDSVTGVVDEMRPVITKLDGAADELVPASKRIEPILEKAATSVDLLNVDLVRVEGILSDVNTVTGTGARVSDAVSGAADAVATGVGRAAAKVAGKVQGRAAAKIAGAEQPHLEAPGAEEVPPAEVERVSGDDGYFTYPAAGGPEAEGASAVATQAGEPVASVASDSAAPAPIPDAPAQDPAAGADQNE